MPTNYSLNETSAKLTEAGDFLGKLITFGLLGLMFFSTLAFGAVEAWSVAIFSLSVMVMMLLWTVKVFADRQLSLTVPSTAWPLLALIAYGALQSVSLTGEDGKVFAISIDVEATRLALEILAVLFFALLIIANFFNRTEKILWLRNFLIIFGLTVAVFGLIQKFTWNGKYYWFIEPGIPPSSPFGPFVNRNHFAGFLEMIVPIPVALIMVRAVQSEISLFYGFSAVMMSVAIFMTLSRGGMISLMAGLIFVVAFGLKPAIEKVKGYGHSGYIPAVLTRIGAVALILITVSVGIWWVGGDAVIERAQSVEVSGEKRSGLAGRQTLYESRGWIWNDTLAMIKANWMTGVGLGAYQTAYPLFSQSDGSLIVSQAHNDYLQIVADCGVVGAAIGLWFIAALFRNLSAALRHRDEIKIGMALGCGGGIIAILVHSLFDFNLQLPSNALLFLALTAVVSNLAAAASSDNADRILN